MDDLEQQTLTNISKTTSTIDWEQRRYEIAKDIFAHMMLLPHDCLSSLSLTSDDENAAVYAEIAVDLADALIKEFVEKTIKQQ